MGQPKETSNSAIRFLEQRRRDLTDGLESISEQEVSLASLRERVAADEERLALSKKALIEVEAALAILKAGERL